MSERRTGRSVRMTALQDGRNFGIGCSKVLQILWWHMRSWKSSAFCMNQTDVQLVSVSLWSSSWEFCFGRAECLCSMWQASVFMFSLASPECVNYLNVITPLRPTPTPCRMLAHLQRSITCARKLLEHYYTTPPHPNPISYCGFLHTCMILVV